MLALKRFVAACFLFLLLPFVLAGRELPTPDLTLMIPMRDGNELATDFYLPSPDAKGLPCILLRNPAGRKAPTWMHYAELAKAGYVVAYQDTRSAADKEGKTIPFFHDGWGRHQDGYDTVEFLAKHPLTNGKIGTIGFSATGITQLMMAPSAPPSLKCQYIGVAASDMYHQAIYLGGAVLKNQVEGWLNLYAKHPSIFEHLYSQPEYNDFWENFSTNEVAANVRVPAILFTGWFDTFSQGTIDAFTSRQEKGGEGARGAQKLFIGPWAHDFTEQKLGDFAVPTDGRSPPFDFSAKRWFDYHLKEVRNEVEQLPAVTYYVMGPFDGSVSKGNVWRTANSWPIQAESTPLYLLANGQLAWQLEVEKGEKAFHYDMKDPMPTKGGRNLFLESGPKDQTELEARSDMLVFTSAPLSEDLEVTGRIVAKIFMNAVTEATDLSVRLSDVYPDGKSLLIIDGMQRVKKSAKAMPQEVSVDLWSTSMVFAKGHKIRVAVTHSNYPRFELSDISNKISYQILFGKETPSQIIIPVVK